MRLFLAEYLENAFVRDGLAFQDGIPALKYPFAGWRLEDTIVSIQPDTADVKRTES
jgi:hypothetical protein